MAVFYPHTVKCVCNNTLTVHLADSVNVKRFPASREKILRGEMHRTACAQCGRQMTVEKPFYYTDLTRNCFFKVLPRGERHLWKNASAELDVASKLVPGSVTKIKGRTLRVVFGMDELREKLVAQDAGLDDRLIELLKVLLVYEHPILLRQARLRLSLDAVTNDDFEFTASYEHNQKQFRLAMPKRLVNELVDKEAEIKKWAKKAHPQASIFELPDHWVNMWRWSPQPSALDLLKTYAEEVRAGKDVDITTNDFKLMLTGLPRGNHLPGWSKRDLGALFDYAKTKNLQTLEDDLFEIRFGFELEDDWSKNKDLDDIDTLWKLLKDLPDTNVEGNTKIHEILLNAGERGGTYDPSSHDIAIGSHELANKEGFEDVVRHEVGHAVHEMKSALVNSWLESKFGWRIFEANDKGINEWVKLMGGWGSLTAGQQQDVRDALLTAVGNGETWDPGPTPNLPAGHPWHGATFGPRLAFEKTGGSWYRNFNNWHRANKKAFFLNYWYRTFMVVDTKTLDIVAKMPSSYASMSHYEFFAELYALNYDLDDPLRKAIPKDVSDWLDKNIGAPEIDAPAMPSPPEPKREYETITRPSGSERSSGNKSEKPKGKSSKKKK
jgi:hypothetical protein